MEQCYRKDLKPFDKNRLKELCALKKSNTHSFDIGENSSFFHELDSILQYNPKSSLWFKKEKNKVILGDVWFQAIGKYYHRHTVHVYEYMYIDSPGLVIDFHSHEKITHNGKQIIKITEFYIFEDGKVYMCPKDQQHALINTYGKSIYVISLKIDRNATH